MPKEFVGEAVYAALGDVKGLSFLLARADIARADLAVALQKAGAEVKEVAAYRIVPSEGGIVDSNRQPHFITLTSSASARSTIERLEQLGLGSWLRRSGIVCIGPVTAATVRELGYEVAETAEQYTTDGIVETLLRLSRREVAHA